MTRVPGMRLALGAALAIAYVPAPIEAQSAIERIRRAAEETRKALEKKKTEEEQKKGPDSRAAPPHRAPTRDVPARRTLRPSPT